MILRYHSPLPPERTGVADYSAALLGELTRHAEVITNPTDAGPGINVYHIGNNGFHHAAYLRALAEPGVVVLHDAVLQHYFLGHLPRDVYVEEFVHNYGEWHRPFGETLWAERASASSDARFFEWPMLRRLMDSAQGVIVHNAAAMQAVLRHATRTRVEVIPHLFTPPPEPDPDAVALLRARWGVADGTAIIGVFGYLRETKRIPSVVRAYERARMRGAKLALLVSGDFVSKGLEAQLAASLAQPGVIRRGYVEEDEFWLQAYAVDACVNLRVPSAGESSGIATRLMGIGKAVFLTEGPEVAHFPSGSYFPVSAGREEEAELEEMFVAIARDGSLTREMGRLARRHVVREQSLERVGEAYLRFLKLFD